MDTKRYEEQLSLPIQSEFFSNNSKLTSTEMFFFSIIINFIIHTFNTFIVKFNVVENKLSPVITSIITANLSFEMSNV